MDKYKRDSRIIGILFLIVTLGSILGSEIVEKLMYDTNYLDTAYLNKTKWILGMLIHFVSTIGTVGIVVFMFPYLKKQSVHLAAGYLVFRIFEAIIISFSEIHSLSILTLSQQYIELGATESTLYQALGNMVQEARSLEYKAGVFFFCIGSFMFYFSMIKSKIVPLFISVWGLIAIILALTANIMSMIGIEFIGILFYAPIALNELFLSLWLILKGFNIDRD